MYMWCQVPPIEEMFIFKECAGAHGHSAVGAHATFRAPALPSLVAGCAFETLLFRICALLSELLFANV